jgi:MarR family 2-MHQ and catechol resistance regulon transcriptional repressor
MKRTHYKGTKDEVRALGTFVKLVRAAESVTARIHRHLIDTGLSVSQFGVLEALFHVGPLSQAEIAKKILRSTGNITMVIDNLEKRDLVKRERQVSL